MARLVRIADRTIARDAQDRVGILAREPRQAKYFVVGALPLDRDAGDARRDFDEAALLWAGAARLSAIHGERAEHRPGS